MKMNRAAHHRRTVSQVGGNRRRLPNASKMYRTHVQHTYVCIGHAVWLATTCDCERYEDSTTAPVSPFCASLLFAILSAVRIWVLLQCFCSHTNAHKHAVKPLCVHTQGRMWRRIYLVAHTQPNATITTKPQELAAAQYTCCSSHIFPAAIVVRPNALADWRGVYSFRTWTLLVESSKYINFTDVYIRWASKNGGPFGRIQTRHHRPTGCLPWKPRGVALFV